MTSEVHSMVKVEADEDRARLVTEVNENEQKFSEQTRLLVNKNLPYLNIHPFLAELAYPLLFI